MRALLALLLLLLAPLAQAHPLAPALLELKEAGDSRYEMLWRASVLQAIGVEPQLPQDCRAIAAATQVQDHRGAITTRWSVHCESSLDGRELSVPGLDRAGINVILRLQRADGSVQKALLDARRPAWTVPPAEAVQAVFPAYLELGVGHLLFGFDHVLFVAGMVLLVRRLKPLLWTVSGFTLGHSITLSLAALGLVRVPQALTELAIALSILLLACELARGSPSRLSRRPALMAASFGLLHGLGFAGALAEIGLPQAEIPLALLAFNLGIELGQLALVATLLLAGFLARRLPGEWGERAATLRVLPVYLIGTLAAYWCLERAAALGG